jgi:hypothetical protein
MWTETTGIVSRHMMIAEIIGQEYIWIWNVQLPTDAHSMVYNFDSLATADLMPGKAYSLVVQTYDSDGHQATTSSTFSVSNL